MLQEKNYILAGLLVVCSTLFASVGVRESADRIEVRRDGIVFTVLKQGFRFSVTSDDSRVKLPAHTESGLYIESYKASLSQLYVSRVSVDADTVKFEIGLQGRPICKINMIAGEQTFRFSLRQPAGASSPMALRCGAARPGYGLGDNQINEICPGFTNPVNGGRGTEITGFDAPRFTNLDGVRTRMISNFSIYPAHGFAMINMDAAPKLVKSTADGIMQGSVSGNRVDNFYLFFGTPHQIYAAYKEARQVNGYETHLPRYEFFGIGWEAWGALAWETNQKSVQEDIAHYLSLGIPLSWAVIGSGFWPLSKPELRTTTSFGMWGEKYPHPQQLTSWLHDRNIKMILGLRIAFTEGGLYTQEGLDKGYFVREQEEQVSHKISFPKHPSYLLDAHNPEAVEWYAGLCDKWGADGFKEDLFGYTAFGQLPDDKLNAVNRRLKEKGYLVMGRNSYLGSPCDVHRIEDFNYDMDQDRGILNTLILAYSGFPNTYPDMIGGLFGGQDFDGEASPRICRYMMRNARMASLHATMAVGKGPWHFGNDKVTEVMVDAALDHDRFQPYLYSQAVRFYHDGYPWTMQPLPLAFAGDTVTYYRENNIDRGYQWMIGDALMAVPLYGEDYETAGCRDVYLPGGVWFDYDSKQRFEGGRILKDYALPVEKCPLFVGGTGIVFEKSPGGIVCAVYPVGKAAATRFYYPDGISFSDVEVVSVYTLRAGVYEKESGRLIVSDCDRDGIRTFTPEKGKNYIIR